MCIKHTANTDVSLRMLRTTRSFRRSNLLFIHTPRSWSVYGLIVRHPTTNHVYQTRRTIDHPPSNRVSPQARSRCSQCSDRLQEHEVIVNIRSVTSSQTPSIGGRRTTDDPWYEWSAWTIRGDPSLSAGMIRRAGNNGSNPSRDAARVTRTYGKPLPVHSDRQLLPRRVRVESINRHCGCLA